ncbi:MAG TPA: hypothetical protein VLY63_09325 [Anaerolineae bacterium]|nr:hypothetical protein [Anaerolineae bacterium]
MSGNWSGRMTLFAIAASTMLGFLLWLFCLYLLWLFLEALGLTVDYWNMTQALSSAVAVAALMGGGVIAYREMTEASSGRHVQVADTLFGELNSPESVEARRWIYQNLPKEPAEDGLGSLPPEGRAYVKQTLNSLDRVAFLTQAGWIPKETIMPWMNPMIVKSWEKLELWVEQESQRRREPDYYEHARRLGEDCIAWRKQYMAFTGTEYLEDAL